MSELSSLQIRMIESQDPTLSKDAIILEQPNHKGLTLKWWLLVALNIIFVLAGQSVATLLGRFYYEQGGNSKWMATLVQTVAFPILYVPLFFFHFSNDSSVNPPPISKPSFIMLVAIYFVLGLLLAGQNFLYSIGLLYLPVSTYSLICASQLAFNAVFSYFLNSQKFTILIFNSTITLTLSASLLAVGESSGSTEVSGAKYALGFACTVGASAGYALLLSLMQLTFQKVLKRETFAVVLDMQIYTSIVASCACLVGLFASGEWSSLNQEMDGFKKGRLAYLMTLIWTAIGWQMCSVGVVGLIFLVSSLFSNVISTFALPVVPVFAVIFFHDKMGGVKVIALLMAIWGFTSYLYQNYLDDKRKSAAAAVAATEQRQQ
ncbi:hypothetical protein Syun_018818 [Stephania yunnanensis]|uniref:Probable purine permease n=1 Tax=Stephania yunnanensis TaxID=152371 RepID=A0AAP0IVA8_9MAGN